MRRLVVRIEAMLDAEAPAHRAASAGDVAAHGLNGSEGLGVVKPRGSAACIDQRIVAAARKRRFRNAEDHNGLRRMIVCAIAP